jgi:CheY-like chemotaxis protein
MRSTLIVLTGPPLPGRWSLARGIEQRCAARRFQADSGRVPRSDLAPAFGRGGCVLVDGDLPTRAARAELLAMGGDERLLVEWRCGRTQAEREVFHRYASRPRVLASAELSRYLDDLSVREPVGDELREAAVGARVHVVRVGPDETPQEQVERVVAALSEAPPPLAERRRRRVMVVEDDPEQRAMLAEVLEELGFAVEVAPDAGVAMALLDEGVEVELLLSDQQMPGMSGVELAHEAAERRPPLRTVLLTAYGDEETCRRAVAASAVTVLSKPLSVIDLERVLEEAGG